MTSRLGDHSLGKVAVAISVLGAAAFYLWQPISDYFLTGNFEPNLAVIVETDDVFLSKAHSLLVIHVKTINRGNVPVELLGSNGKGELTLEVRKMDLFKNADWINPDSLPLLATKNILQRHKGSYVLEPNGIFDEVESMPLPNGIYWVKGTLVYPDGDYIDHVAIVKLGN